MGWWHGPLFPSDKVYASKIFKYTHDSLPEYVIRGGTGYNLDPMPEHFKQVKYSGGWFLYPNFTSHLGFSERGCRLKCSFCVVPEKDGTPTFESSISDLLPNSIVLGISYLSSIVFITPSLNQTTGKLVFEILLDTCKHLRIRLNPFGLAIPNHTLKRHINIFDLFNV